MQDIIQVTGTFKSSGQRKINKTNAQYSHVHIETGEQNKEHITNVIVPNTVDSYIFSGVRGTFYIVRLNRGKNLIFAFSNEKRKIYDRADISLFNRMALSNIGLWIFTSVVCLPLLSYVLGLILLPIALFGICSNYQIHKNMRNRKLEAYLKTAGFSLDLS